MDSLSLRVLKSVANHRELSLRECAALLPRKTNDHLDFYPLASLIKRGLVDLYMTMNGDPLSKINEMELAISIHCHLEGEKGITEYLGRRFSGGSFGDEKVFATANGYFALDEMRSKRVERLWAISIGTFTAIVAASIKGMIG
jgi:hypothetical protein